MKYNLHKHYIFTAFLCYLKIKNTNMHFYIIIINFMNDT